MNRPTCCGGEYVPTPTGQRAFHRRTCWKYLAGTKVGEETREDERNPAPEDYTDRPTCCGGEYVPTPTGQRAFHRWTCWRYKPGTKVGEETRSDERNPAPGEYVDAHLDDDDDVRDVKRDAIDP